MFCYTQTVSWVAADLIKCSIRASQIVEFFFFLHSLQWLLVPAWFCLDYLLNLIHVTKIAHFSTFLKCLSTYILICCASFLCSVFHYLNCMHFYVCVVCLCTFQCVFAYTNWKTYWLARFSFLLCLSVCLFFFQPLSRSEPCSEGWFLWICGFQFLKKISFSTSAVFFMK